jgi:RNA-directed DNA polymerase
MSNKREIITKDRFSGSRQVLQQKNKLIETIKKIITIEGFKINTQKTKIATRSTRQVVTSIVVNKKLNQANK